MMMKMGGVHIQILWFIVGCGFNCVFCDLKSHTSVGTSVLVDTLLALPSAPHCYHDNHERAVRGRSAK